MLYRTNSIVIIPLKFITRIQSNAESDYLHKALKTKPTKPHTNYIFLCQKLPTFRHHWCPLASSLSSKGVTGELESRKASEGGTGLPAQTHSSHHVCAKGRGIPAQSTPQGQETLSPPWGESTEQKPKPHLPGHILHFFFDRQKG